VVLRALVRVLCVCGFISMFYDVRVVPAHCEGHFALLSCVIPLSLIATLHTPEMCGCEHTRQNRTIHIRSAPFAYSILFLVLASDVIPPTPCTLLVDLSVWANDIPLILFPCNQVTEMLARGMMRKM
jgi:hypothetical protein